MYHSSVTFREECSHVEVAGSESDDGSLVELVGDCGRQRQESTQLHELGVFLLTTSARRRLALLLHRCLARATTHTAPHSVSVCAAFGQRQNH